MDIGSRARADEEAEEMTEKEDPPLLSTERKLRSPDARKPCMFCGRELRALYPYYKILRKENAWRSPKTVGRICEDCMGARAGGCMKK